MSDTDYKISVKVASSFVEAQSDVSQGRYVLAYTVSIHNAGNVPAKLLTRHWIITDSNCKVH